MKRRSFFTKLFGSAVAGMGAVIWGSKSMQWEGIVTQDRIRAIRYTRNQWGAWCGTVLQPMTHEQVREMLSLSGVRLGSMQVLRDGENYAMEWNLNRPDGN